MPIAIALLSHSASGGGGGGQAPDPTTGCTDTTCGTLLVSLTNADGDFLSYSVDVLSLTLEKANDGTVETLPARQRVDFAELVGLTELVTAATIPNGTYVRASITFDYADVEVTAELNGDLAGVTP